MHAGAGGAAMQSVHAPGGAGARDVLFWSCGAHAFSFFFFPAPAVRVANACRPMLLVVSATTRTECTTT